ncbi:SRPBCC domain-containing protein [Cognatiyoonia sp. IB215182]|uniref:SRPBCC domain-containing protein n=1 Tax=Cognatiyoonia sp. IB215182 TaxID=3097353 RepID=UPI0039B73E11
MIGKVHEIDASVGGGYVISLHHRDETPAVPGKTTKREERFRVVFDELVPGRQVVQRVLYEVTDPSFAEARKQTWTFQSSGRLTTVPVACENVPLDIRPEDYAAGLNSSLLNLATAAETS